MRRDLVGRQRAAPGAAHPLVDVAVEVAVERVRAAGRERAADERRHDQPQPRQPASGEEHHRQGRDQQQLDDPRLGQCDVRRQPLRQPGRTAAGPRARACADGLACWRPVTGDRRDVPVGTWFGRRHQSLGWVAGIRQAPLRAAAQLYLRGEPVKPGGTTAALVSVAPCLGRAAGGRRGRRAGRARRGRAAGPQRRAGPGARGRRPARAGGWRPTSSTGFRIDRGFQVLNTGYPERSPGPSTWPRWTCALRAGRPGPDRGPAATWSPTRCDAAGAWLSTLRAPIGALGGQGAGGRRLRRAGRCARRRPARTPGRHHPGPLAGGAGVSPQFIETFLRPFLSGVLLERELSTSARFTDLVWRSFARGTIAVPALGMGADRRSSWPPACAPGPSSSAQRGRAGRGATRCGPRPGRIAGIGGHRRGRPGRPRPGCSGSSAPAMHGGDDLVPRGRPTARPRARRWCWTAPAAPRSSTRSC